MPKTYYVYILTNVSQTLYIGITSNLPLRLEQHRSQTRSSFTSRYHVWKLVHAEAYDDAKSAIDREKQLKRWRREKKIALISASNPNWIEISTW